MKKLIGSLLLMVVTINFSLAQSQPPKNSFRLELAQPSLEVYQGDQQSVDVYLNRAKNFRKVPIDLVVATPLPDGMEITFEEKVEDHNWITVWVITGNEVPEGKYPIVLNGKSARGSKGTILNLIVMSNSVTGN